MDNQEMFNEVVADIYKRCDGDFDKMTVTDKILYKQMMEEMKNNVHNFIKDWWHIVNFWCELDIEAEIEKAKQPDLGRLHELLNNQILNTFDRSRF